MVELFVPKYEREQRQRRFELLDSIAENSPKSFPIHHYYSRSLSKAILEKSKAGDGVCRVINNYLMDVDGEKPMHIETSQNGSNTCLNIDNGSNALHVSFVDSNKVGSIVFSEDTNEGTKREEITWVWPAFASGLLKVVRDDLVINRERWTGELKKDADEFVAEVEQIDPVALGETTKLVRRLEEEAAYYGDGEIFVWGSLDGEGKNDHPSSILTGKKIVELNVAAPASLVDSLGRIRSHYDFDYNWYLADFRNILNYGPGDAVEINYPNFGIRINEVEAIGYPVEFGLVKVEDDFREFISTGGRIRDGVLLKAYSGSFQPYFDFQ